MELVPEQVLVSPLPLPPSPPLMKGRTCSTWGFVFVVLCSLGLWRCSLKKVLTTLFSWFVMPMLLYKVNNPNHPIKFQHCALIE